MFNLKELENKQILITFGDELSPISASFIKATIGDDSYILGLDEEAIKYADENNIKSFRITDILSSEELTYLTLYASYNKSQWLKDKKELFSTLGIFWPAVDYEYLEEFWRNTLLSMLLAETLTDLKVKDILILSSYMGLYSNPYTSNDTWKSVLKQHHHDYKNDPSHTIKRIFNSFKDYTKGLDPYQPFPRFITQDHDTDIIPNAPELEKIPFDNINTRPIFMIMSSWECPRNKLIINEMHQKYPKNFFIISLDDAHAIKRQLGDDIQVIEFTLTFPQINAGPFVNGLNYVFEQCKNVGLAYDAFLVQYNFMLMIRWPYLTEIYKKWDNFICQYKPAMLMTQLRFEAIYKIPILAAIRRGVPCLGYPDGRFDGFMNNWGDQNIMVDSPVAKESFVSNQTPYEKIRICKPMFPENTYNVDTSKGFQTDKTKIIVFLPSTRIKDQKPIFYGNVYSSGANDIIEELTNIPPHLKNKIEILFKSHPGDTGDPRYLPKIPQEMYIDNNADLMPYLQKADLAIDLNFSSGTAILNTLKLGKPIMVVSHKMVLDIYNHITLYSSAGLVIKELSNFWNYIDKFITDESFRTNLTVKGKRFIEKYYSVLNYTDSFAEVVEEILSNKANGNGYSPITCHGDGTSLTCSEISQILNISVDDKDLQNPQVIETSNSDSEYRKFICNDSNNNPILFFQSRISKSNRVSLTNPYDPQFLTNDIDMFLAPERGEVQELDLYWRCNFNLPNINEIPDLHKQIEVLINLVNTLYKNQAESLINSDRSFPILQEIAFQRVLKWDSIKECFLYSTQDERSICSWSHGSLFPYNIYFEKDFKLDHWEWSSEIAPFGVDGLDIFINFCTQALRCSVNDALAVFKSESNKQLLPLIKAVKTTFFNSAPAEIAIKYWLTRRIAQLLANNIELNFDVYCPVQI